MSDNTDPNIIKRLEKQPPYDEEKPKDEAVSQETEETPEETPENEEKVEETETPEAVEEETPETPVDETKKRTAEQFNKLKESNNKLKEALETEKKKNILESLIPEVPNVPVDPTIPTTNVVPQANQYPGLTQKQINETFAGLVDDEGYVDRGVLLETLNGLNEKSRQAEERANQAEQRSQQTARQFDDFQRNQIMREVHAQYPTLDPENEKFDEKLWKFVRNEVIDQWMTGRPTDVMAAAQEGVETLYGAQMKKAEKEQIEKAETAKKNINALGASQTSQRDTYGEREALVKATQTGKKGALAERLRKAGY